MKVSQARLKQIIKIERENAIRLNNEKGIKIRFDFCEHDNNKSQS